MKKDKNVIELKPIGIEYARITIEGVGDICLNKMNARTIRALTRTQNGEKTVKEVPNRWEDIITSLHWHDDLPMKDTYTESNEDMYHKLLAKNKPCITAFGLKKSFLQAVVRNEIDKYSTKMDNALNVIASKGLVPITFAEASIDERLMSPKKGSPVLVYLNHFSGWMATFDISYTESVYSLEEIVNIINLAGFGLGIGSGRSSGYGRYKVVKVEKV